MAASFDGTAAPDLPRHWRGLRFELGIEGEVTDDASAVHSLVHDQPPAGGCLQLEQRLQAVLSRALRTDLEFGVSVTVHAALAPAWAEAEFRQSLGVRASPSG